MKRKSILHTIAGLIAGASCLISVAIIRFLKRPIMFLAGFELTKDIGSWIGHTILFMVVVIICAIILVLMSIAIIETLDWMGMLHYLVQPAV